MHTYRDAIKDKVGAFILYPDESNELYKYHGASHDYEGVGGITLILKAKSGQPVDNE